MKMSPTVEKLKVNFKTLEEFKEFKEYGLQELSMLEDLEANIIDNDIASPFYGIYFGDKLVARMSLYEVNAIFNRSIQSTKYYLELWKLEVLPEYQNQGFGTALVEFAKSEGLPIKTYSRVKSKDFWRKMGFFSPETEGNRPEDNSLIWLPEKFTAKTAS